MEHKRSSWGSSIGFLMAAVGSAVGLGNIWGFPYKMGRNGGFAFLLIYLALGLIIGFTALVGELTIGRRSKQGAAGAYKALSKRFRWVGYMGVLAAFLITGFYSVLGGYCIKYFVLNMGSIFGASFGAAGSGGEAIFTSLITNQTESVLYTVVFLVMTCVIVMGGIKGGIEKFSKVAMPALFVMLIAVAVRSLTLPGAREGIDFMFRPDWVYFRENFLTVLSSAGSQMFLSLSLGMGIMITYGSYLPDKEDIEKNSFIIFFCDTLVAVLAGLAVIPAAFALGGPNAAMGGPKLLFITLQNVFEAMGAFGPVFGVIFYLLVIIAAVTSSVSLLEVVTTFCMDEEEKKGKHGNRSRITVIATVLEIILAGVVAADGLGSTGMIQPLGFSWLDFLDLLTEGIMLPLGTFFMALFLGWEFGIGNMEKEIVKCGNRFRMRRVFPVLYRFVLPVAMVFLLLGQLQSYGVI